MEQILITKDELEKYHSISRNLNQTRIEMEIRSAQQSDVKLFLGDALYFDMVENYDSVKYQTLLNGGTYTYQTYSIYFSGVKQLIAAYAYGRLVANNTMRVTNKGNKNKLDVNSTEVSNSYRNVKATEGTSEALRIQRELWQFLDDDPTTYPLFNVTRRKQRTSGFNFSRI
jgi:hypothetical protein